MIVMTSQIDPTRQIPSGPTSFMTERNEYEVRCGMCARPVYVDADTYQNGSEATASGVDNQYRCEICAEEYGS